MMLHHNAYTIYYIQKISESKLSLVHIRINLNCLIIHKFGNYLENDSRNHTWWQMITYTKQLILAHIAESNLVVC